MPRTLHASRYRQLNLILLALMAVLTAGALFAVPLCLVPQDLRWGWLLVPVALLTNLFWALHHEAIHGVFHGNRRGNLLAGRMMAILLARRSMCCGSAI